VVTQLYIKRVVPGPGHVTYSRAVTFYLNNCQKIRYRQIERWFLKIVIRATSKKKVRPVRHRMHIREVEYKDFQRRGGCHIISSIFAYKGSR